MKNELLKVEGLCAEAKNKKIFSDINFSINPGEVVGLLGHNGAGKSTILRLIANHTIPHTGSVTINNKTNNINTHQKEVVLIPDTIKLFKRKSIIDNYKLITNNYDADYKAFIKYLNSLHISEHEFICDLSKGNQEIVQLAIYFAINTQLYLLDEPFSAVDIYRREFIQKMIIDLMLRNENCSIIVTTHLIADMEAIIERIIYLDSGSIVIDQTTETLIENHENLTDYLKDYFRNEVGFDDFI